MKIAAAVAERCAGPGWSNTPVIVYYYDRQELHCEYLQPEEQSAEMRALFSVCAEANAAMTSAVESLLYKNPSLRKRFPKEVQP